MPRKDNAGGKFYVGDVPRDFASQAMATSFAQTMACRAKEDVTFYVREEGAQGALVRVDRVGRDVVTQRLR